MTTLHSTANYSQVQLNMIIGVVELIELIGEKIACVA